MPQVAVSGITTTVQLMVGPTLVPALGAAQLAAICAAVAADLSNSTGQLVNASQVIVRQQAGGLAVTVLQPGNASLAAVQLLAVALQSPQPSWTAPASLPFGSSVVNVTAPVVGVQVMVTAGVLAAASSPSDVAVSMASALMGSPLSSALAAAGIVGASVVVSAPRSTQSSPPPPAPPFPVFSNSSALVSYAETATASLSSALQSSNSETLQSGLTALTSLASGLLNNASATPDSSTTVIRASLLDAVGSCAASVAAQSQNGTTVAAGVLDSITSFVSVMVASSVAQSTSNATVLPPEAVASVLSTLNLCVASSSSSAPLSAASVANIASATAALASSSSLSGADVFAALTLFSAVAASPSAGVSLAGTVAQGLASTLGSAAAALDTTAVQQGMGVVSALAATLNAAVDGTQTVAANAVRESLLSVVVSSTTSSQASAGAAQASISTVDALMGATAALLNASGVAVTSSSPPTVQLTATMVDLVLGAIGTMVGNGGAALSAASASNVVMSTAILVSNATALSPAAAGTAMALFLAAVQSPQAQPSMPMASSIAYGVSSVLAAPASSSSTNVSLTTQSRAGALVAALSNTLVTLAKPPAPPPPPRPRSPLPPAPQEMAARASVPTVYVGITAFGRDLEYDPLVGDGGSLDPVLTALALATGSRPSDVSIRGTEFLLTFPLDLLGLSVSNITTAGVQDALGRVFASPLDGSTVLSVQGVSGFDASSGQRRRLLQSNSGVEVAVMAQSAVLSALENLTLTVMASSGSGDLAAALQSVGVATTGTALPGEMLTGLQMHVAFSCPPGASNITHVLKRISPGGLDDAADGFLADLNNANLGTIDSVGITLLPVIGARKLACALAFFKQH